MALTQVPSSMFESNSYSRGPAFSMLVITNGATPNTQISVTANYATLVSAGGVVKNFSGVSLTINGATTGANALDTGALGPNQWYSVWVISDGTNVAGLLSTSATAPTMPGAYTFKARAGWVRTDGSSTFLRSLQRGSNARYKLVAGSNTTAYPQVVNNTTIGNNTTPTYVSTDISSYVPPTASFVLLTMRATTTAGGGNRLIMAAPNGDHGIWGNTSGTAPLWGAIAYDLGSSTIASPYTAMEVPIETQQTIYFVSANLCYCWAIGWTDQL